MILRQWRGSDAQALADALNNKNILDKLRDGLPYPYTKADAAAYIRTMESSPLAFAIVQDDVAIGSIGLFRGGNIHFRTAELGYYIAQPYWGRGIGTQAIREICAYAFQSTDLLRIYAEPFRSNAASRRVLEKAGFTFEGILRQNAVKNGEILDMALYALLRADAT
ncbi:MAG: GNAT family N-acetyltransferase [Oscillospiraceae bacterium]|jgi:RimJ/RimL family protein N-acetyltransferase|nr:GNAT family N-acetyltransferase [Oscillospiraceae bacterium]